MPFVTEFWLDRVACLSDGLGSVFLPALAVRGAPPCARFVYGGTPWPRRQVPRGRRRRRAMAGTRHDGRDRDGAERNSRRRAVAASRKPRPGAATTATVATGAASGRTSEQASTTAESHRTGQGRPRQAGRHQGAGEGSRQDRRQRERRPRPRDPAQSKAAASKASPAKAGGRKTDRRARRRPAKAATAEADGADRGGCGEGDSAEPATAPDRDEPAAARPPDDEGRGEDDSRPKTRRGAASQAAAVGPGTAPSARKTTPTEGVDAGTPVDGGQAAPAQPRRALERPKPTKAASRTRRPAPLRRPPRMPRPRERPWPSPRTPRRRPRPRPRRVAPRRAASGKAGDEGRAARRAQRGGDREDPGRAVTSGSDELRDEYDQTLSEITELQRDRLTDSAGDDQADTGTKTFEREQEITPRQQHPGAGHPGRAGAGAARRGRLRLV